MVAAEVSDQAWGRAERQNRSTDRASTVTAGQAGAGTVTVAWAASKAAQK